jgi:hypothetical protein
VPLHKRKFGCNIQRCFVDVACSDIYEHNLANSDGKWNDSILNIGCHNLKNYVFSSSKWCDWGS